MYWRSFAERAQEATRVVRRQLAAKSRLAEVATDVGVGRGRISGAARVPLGRFVARGPEQEYPDRSRCARSCLGRSAAVITPHIAASTEPGSLNPYHRCDSRQVEFPRADPSSPRNQERGYVEPHDGGGPMPGLGGFRIAS